MPSSSSSSEDLSKFQSVTAGVESLVKGQRHSEATSRVARAEEDGGEEDNIIPEGFQRKLWEVLQRKLKGQVSLPKVKLRRRKLQQNAEDDLSNSLEIRLFKRVAQGSAFDAEAINRTVHPDAPAAKPRGPTLSHKKVVARANLVAVDPAELLNQASKAAAASRETIGPPLESLFDEDEKAHRVVLPETLQRLHDAKVADVNAAWRKAQEREMAKAEEQKAKGRADQKGKFHLPPVSASRNPAEIFKLLTGA